MPRSLTPSQENYLEHIHVLSRSGVVRMSDIAGAAGVRLPSVTRAVAKLAEQGFVQHRAYGVVEITRNGILAAEAVVRRDNCLHGLLVDVLDMEEDAARVEVCRLEHVLSAEVLDRMEALLRHATSSSSSRWLSALHKTLRQRLGRPRRSRAAQVGNASLHAAGGRDPN